MSTTADRKLEAAKKHSDAVDRHLTQFANRATPHTAIVVGAWLCEAITSLEACEAIGIALMTREPTANFEDIATDRMNAFCSRIPPRRLAYIRKAALEPSSPST